MRVGQTTQLIQLRDHRGRHCPLGKGSDVVGEFNMVEEPDVVSLFNLIFTYTDGLFL